MNTKIKFNQDQISGDKITENPTIPCKRCGDKIVGNHLKIGTFAVKNQETIEISWMFLCEYCTIDIGSFLQLKKIISFDSKDFEISLDNGSEIGW